MSDVNYLGLGVNFIGVDKGLFKKMERAKKQSIELTDHFTNLEQSISKSDLAMSKTVDQSIAQSQSNSQSLASQVLQNSASISQASKGWSGGLVGGFKGVGQTTGKFFKGVGQGFKNMVGQVRRVEFTIAKFASSLAVLNFLKDMDPLKKLIFGTGEIQKTTKEIDSLRARMTQVFDAKQANQFRFAITDMMNQFGVTGEQASTIAETMTQFSVPIGQIQESLPEIGQLVGVLNMDAKSTAEMFARSSKQLRIMPKDMMGVVKKVNAMGAAFGILDFTQDLPEIVDGVSDSLLKLGRMNKTNAMQAIESTAKIKAQFQAMGMGSSQATQAAVGFQTKMTDMTHSIQRMRVGLDPLNEDWRSFANTISVATGKGFDEAARLMDQGVTDSAATMGELIEIGRMLPKDDANRFKFQLMDIFGDAGKAIAQAIESPLKLDEALALAVENTKKIDPEEQLKKQLKAQQNTFEHQTRLLEVNKELVDVERELAAKGPIIKSLRDQTDGFRKVQSAIQDANSKLGKMIITMTMFEKGGLAAVAAFMEWDKISGVIERLAPFFASTGPFAVGLAFVGAAIGTVVSGVAKFTTLLWGLGKNGVKVFAFLGKEIGLFASHIPSMIKTMGPMVLKLGLMVAALGAAEIVAKNFGFILDSIGTTVDMVFLKFQQGYMKLVEGFVGVKKFFGMDVSNNEKYLKELQQTIDSGQDLIDQQVKGIQEYKIDAGITGKVLDSIIEATVPMAEKFTDGIIEGAEAVKEMKMPSMSSVADDVVDGIATEVSQGIKQGVSSVSKNISKEIKDGVSKTKIETPNSIEKGVFNSGLPLDPALQKIYDTQGKDAAVEEAMKRINQDVSIKPNMNQEGAPKRAKLGSAFKGEMSKADDKNFNALIGAMQNMRDTLEGAIEGLASQPVLVNLQGDTRKFLQVIEQNSKTRITSMGKQGALGRT